MSKPKNRERKHISISDLYLKYSTLKTQFDFFFHFKWTDGFIYPKCGCVHFTYSLKRGIYECKQCHHQTTTKAETVLQASKLSLFKWILILCFICDSTNGISDL